MSFESKRIDKQVDWGRRAQTGFLASGIDPSDRRGHKNYYIDLLQKMALEKALELKGDELVLDFGCGSGRISYWLAPRVKRVIGLEVTPEMIQLAERNRRIENVEFVLYDGVRFPNLLYPVDLILSVGVLQTMEIGTIKRTLSELANYLRNGGKFCLVEQTSDNPKMHRPGLREYLQAFEESNLDCLQYYPIRNGRWWLLYLVRYGMIPKGWFGQIAHHELEKRKRERGFARFYKDFLFLLKKKR